MTKETSLTPFKTEEELKTVLAKQYMKTITNLLGNEQSAREFMSNIMASVQRLPKLMECTPESFFNSFVTMASLKLMPSGVSGEAYVLPYNNKGTLEAQFQLGYQGLVTLFYRAGAKTIVAEIVYSKDEFSNLNGEIRHVADPFAEERGEPIGAYVIVELQSGGKINKVMSKAQILNIGKKFSKSFSSSFSPWSVEHDPELWMWRKTVLKQAAKLVPKNETIYKALAADNKDSIISDKQTDPTNLAPAEVDTSAQEKALKKCKTLADLERLWADVPGDIKVKLKALYDEMRAILTTEAK